MLVFMRGVRLLRRLARAYSPILRMGFRMTARLEIILVFRFARTLTRHDTPVVCHLVLDIMDTRRERD